MTPPYETAETLNDCRTRYLRGLGELLQASGMVSGAAVEAVRQGAGTYFDEVVDRRQHGSFEKEADGLTSSRITLVGDDELELDIRLDNLSTRLFDITGGSLWKTYLRFITLLDRPELARVDNPVGPQGIRRGLYEMFVAAGGITLDKKLDLLDKLEDCLLQKLPPLYAEINDFLHQAGVEAALPIIVSAPEPSRRFPPGGLATPPGNLLLTLQQSLLAQLPGLAGPAKEASGSAAALLNQAVLERLLFRLNELDQQAQPASFEPTRTNSLESLIPGLFDDDQTEQPATRTPLTSTELGIPAHAPEAVAIDTLSLIFAAIFSDPKLPDTLKTIISSLQITMLKVAMQDAAFFTDPAHPARELLDRMGQATLGLPVDVQTSHPVCARLFAIASRLRSEFSGDTGVFVAARSEVDKLIASRQADIARSAESYLPLLHQLERRDHAIAQTCHTLDKLIDPGLPETIRNFLDHSWRRVLQAVWLEHGPASVEWKSHAGVVGDLLWSIAPKPGAEGRAALTKRLPEMLRVLQNGMERIGMPQEAQAEFLDTCFSLQNRAMRSTPIPLPEGNPAPAGDAGKARPADAAPIEGEIQSNSLRLRTLDFAGHHPAPTHPLPCKPGDWLEVDIAADRTAIAYLYRLSEISQRPLLCNPDEDLALSIHPAILDRQFSEGRARVCDTLTLFETAAARALSGRSSNRA